MGENVRKLPPGRLIIASHNDGKVSEINKLVSSHGLEAVSAKKLGLIDPEETGKTFAANAILKAQAAATASNLPALADDSGLAVDALGGAPGIYSARWGGESRDFSRAMHHIQAALADVGADDYSAKFVCTLCVAWPDGHQDVFEGNVHGHLAFPPKGDKGFGYDPIFVPTGHEQTFAQMDPAAKHAMSHRADAFAKLKAALLD